MSVPTVTYQLNLRDVLFPPNGLLELGLECREEVVRVHDNMYKAIDDTQEGGVAARPELVK